MIEKDTVRLLRECDAGIKMGVSAINDVLDYVNSSVLKRYLLECKEQHLQLKEEISQLLNKYHDEGKDPNLMVQGMSWIKINAKLMLNDSDRTIADLMSDGCNMGIKSLTRFLNQYQAADEKSKDITKKLIKLEKELVEKIHNYL